MALVANVSNPEIFVIGGGVSKAGNVLLDYIQKYYQKYAFKGCRGALFTLATLAMTLVFTRCQTGVEIIPVSSAKDPHKITTYPAQSGAEGLVRTFE